MRRDFDNDDGSSPAGLNPPLPCLWCSRLTPRAILNQYGARCIGCYERYVREQQPEPVGLRADKRLDKLGWARELKDREENHGKKLPDGRIMTPAQRMMWRSALGFESVDRMANE